MRVISPRLLWHSSITVPVYSDGVDGGGQHRLVDVVDPAGVGQLGRVVDVELGAIGQEGPVGHARGGGDQGQVELALEALAHDLHVQQTQEPAAKADAQGV